MTDLVVYQSDSRENAKEFIVTSPHIIHIQSYHELQMRTQNVSPNLKREPRNEHDYCKMFASQQNTTTCQDMSHTCHMRHICLPADQTIKK